ncbi:hypothetical protein BSR29_03905 [Boudabousia liubingyangii]|uniref:Uncharacterized protein n=1 Tax=Boudabousia liubingyangii TaxID=1921764 RepID=A0A1Q5PN58_9ACTO|nr:hypothetical protein [Boudabousia liubingyangii]OKL48991.1 hypothetical protein BSR29_03905 [Boudabousia liubingyangii]
MSDFSSTPKPGGPQMSYQKARELSAASRFTVTELKGALVALKELTEDPQIAQTLQPFAEVSRYSLPTGFDHSLNELVKLTEPAAATAYTPLEQVDLATLAELLAVRAETSARGLAGMRLAHVLRALADTCSGRDYLTAVELAKNLERSHGELAVQLPAPSEEMPLAQATVDYAHGNLTVPSVLLQHFYSLLAYVSLPQAAYQEGDWQSHKAKLDSRSANTSGEVLEASALPLLLWAAALCRGASPLDPDMLEAVPETLRFQLADLPQVKSPTPITRRAQRLSTCLLEIDGPPGSFSAYQKACHSHDPLWKVGALDPFGWEHYRVLHRCLEPTREIPGLENRRDVLIITPPAPGQNDRTQEPLDTPQANNVILLGRTRPAIRPFVLALSSSPEITRELCLMGVNVLYRPQRPELLRDLLASPEPLAGTLISATEADHELVREVLQGAPVPLVHSACRNELELLNAAAAVVQELHARNAEEILAAQKSALQNSRSHYRQLQCENPGEIALHQGTLEVWTEEQPAGTLRVLLPPELPSGFFQETEYTLQRILPPEVAPEYFSGPQEGLVLGYSW